jgi:hypothetical protein
MFDCATECDRRKRTPARVKKRGEAITFPHFRLALKDDLSGPGKNLQTVVKGKDLSGNYA